MKIRHVRWLCALCVMACLSVSFCSCKPLRPLPDYRDRGFSATVRWESEGVTICAELETVVEEGDLAGLCRVTLSSPSSLAGAVLEKSEQGVAMTLEGVCIESPGADKIWKACALLTSDGEMDDVCDTEWQGLSVRYSEIGEGEDRCSLFRERKTGAPMRIEKGELVLVVERFLHT